MRRALAIAAVAVGLALWLTEGDGGRPPHQDPWNLWRYGGAKVAAVAPPHDAEQPGVIAKPSPPAPKPQPAPAPAPAVVPSNVWDLLVGCEASGNWAHVTDGNGYYFALQFAPGTWLDNGGTQAELDAGTAPSRARLIEVAENTRDAAGGYGPWPGCAARLGLPT